MIAPMLSLTRASSLLLDGGLVIYPTETFYAIGCHPANREALRQIFAIKERPLTKPLPLLCANLGAASGLVDLDQAGFLQKFWPGPLSILLPAKKPLAEELINKQHKAAARISPNPAACELASACGGFLPATSANLSGRRPAATADRLDVQFLLACKESGLAFGICEACPETAMYDSPSTLVEPCFRAGIFNLRILRQGAIPSEALQI